LVGALVVGEVVVGELVGVFVLLDLTDVETPFFASTWPTLPTASFIVFPFEASCVLAWPATCCGVTALLLPLFWMVNLTVAPDVVLMRLLLLVATPAVLI
jgi:hypothetical protein